MPSSPSYRHTEPPDSPAHDSDSDLDLDIQELDPISTAPTRGSKPEPADTSQKTSRIALRNLRMGGLRRAGKRHRTYGELGHDRDAADEDDDSQRLLGDRDDAQEGEDGAPLLGGRPKDNQGRRMSLSSVLRVPSFMSGTRRGPDDEERPGEDDPSSSRIVPVGSVQPVRYPTNMVSNAKYTPWSFLPVVSR